MKHKYRFYVRRSGVRIRVFDMDITPDVSPMYMNSLTRHGYDRPEEFLTPEEVERYAVLSLCSEGTGVPGVGWVDIDGELFINVSEEK